MRVAVEVDFSKFNQTRRVKAAIENDDGSGEWDEVLWVERDEDNYALMSPQLKTKRVLIVQRQDWLRAPIAASTGREDEVD